MSHASSSSADNHLQQQHHHRQQQQQQQQQQQHRQIREVVLVEKPRHLVEDKEDLERLFPRCPPNTLESVGRQNRKSKQQQQSRPETTNNNNNENDVYESVEQQVLNDSAVTPVANIIDLGSYFDSKQKNELRFRDLLLHLLFPKILSIQWFATFDVPRRRGTLKGFKQAPHDHTIDFICFPMKK